MGSRPPLLTDEDRKNYEKRGIDIDELRDQYVELYTQTLTLTQAQRKLALESSKLQASDKKILGNLIKRLEKELGDTDKFIKEVLEKDIKNTLNDVQEAKLLFEKIRNEATSSLTVKSSNALKNATIAKTPTVTRPPLPPIPTVQKKIQAPLPQPPLPRPSLPPLPSIPLESLYQKYKKIFIQILIHRKELNKIFDTLNKEEKQKHNQELKKLNDELRKVEAVLAKLPNTKALVTLQEEVKSTFIKTTAALPSLPSSSKTKEQSLVSQKEAIFQEILKDMASQSSSYTGSGRSWNMKRIDQNTLLTKSLKALFESKISEHAKIIAAKRLLTVLSNDLQKEFRFKEKSSEFAEIVEYAKVKIEKAEKSMRPSTLTENEQNEIAEFFSASSISPGVTPLQIDILLRAHGSEAPLAEGDRARRRRPGT